MSRSGRVGYGIYAFTDMAGAFNRTGIQGTYTYHIPFDRSQLSFGVSLTGYQFRIDEDKMKLLDEDDQLLLNTRNQPLFPMPILVFIIPIRIYTPDFLPCSYSRLP